MKALLLVAIVLLVPALAVGQARTAERIQDVPFSQLDPSGNLPNGSSRHVTNGVPGTTPCTAGGTGAFAMKIAGVWQCGRLTPGVGTGDVLGTAASTPGEVVLFSGTNGKAIGRSNSLSGILLLTSGVASVLASSGTGGVVRDTGATLSNAVLSTPTIGSFISAQHAHSTAAGGGQLNASTVFSTGTIPPARIISGTITNERCLRVSNTGQIEVAAADCGIGGGGSPGGVSGNLTYNEAGTFGALSNTAYDLASGRLTLTQKANSNDTLNILRFTDTSPTGTLFRARNAANDTDLFAVNADGSVSIFSTLVVKNTAAPSTPAATNTVVWADLTDKNLKAKDDAGNVSLTVRAITCTGSDKISAISSAGVPTCSADQTTPGGAGITDLNGLVATSQTFANDTNVTVVSATSTHTITWVGALAKARQHAATMYADQGNTVTTGAQDFGAATSLKVPTAAGASPTANGLVAFDSTSNTLEAGVNGTNRTVAFTAGAQTFSDKTLDNSVIANLRDDRLTLQDNGDATKTVNFELSAIATATNRVVSIPNANSTTVQPTTATSNQFVTHIDSAGVVQKAQPTFANISGSLPETQGGTGQTAVAQGDLLFGSATNTWSRLAKSASATRYLSNTGASNNPAWAQVDLTNGVTGLLPPANWSPLTTKGDLAVHNGTTTIRLAVGSNGTALLADSTQTAGVRWGSVTATAGGSTTQLQRNDTGALGGISGATSDGTAVTFADGALVLNGGDYGASDESLPVSPTEKSFYLNTNASSRRLFLFNDGSFRALFQAGIDQVNLASANVTGVTPLANGGTNQASWTAARCVRVNAGGTALEAAAADCGAGSGTVTATAGALTSNALVLGAGTTDTKVTVGLTTDGVSVLRMGVAGSLAGGLEFRNQTSGTISVVPPSTGALGTNVLTLPIRTATIATTTGTLTSGRCVEIDASGNFIQAAAACGTGSGADTALSNLASVAINTTLASDTDNTDDLGTSSLMWRNAYIGTSIELGHASDTTVTRFSAGNVAVEGFLLTRLIASGTATLGTSAIASGACATVVTVSAGTTATTDVVGWGFNGDPTGVTGYVPSANGMLTIIAYPTSTNVNFKACNNTSASITPGAITLNWRVVR